MDDIEKWVANHHIRMIFEESRDTEIWSNASKLHLNIYMLFM